MHQGRVVGGLTIGQSYRRLLGQALGATGSTPARASPALARLPHAPTSEPTESTLQSPVKQVRFSESTEIQPTEDRHPPPTETSNPESTIIQPASERHKPTARVPSLHFVRPHNYSQFLSQYVDAVEKYPDVVPANEGMMKVLKEHTESGGFNMRAFREAAEQLSGEDKEDLHYTVGGGDVPKGQKLLDTLAEHYTALEKEPEEMLTYQAAINARRPVPVVEEPVEEYTEGTEEFTEATEDDTEATELMEPTEATEEGEDSEIDMLTEEAPIEEVAEKIEEEIAQEVEEQQEEQTELTEEVDEDKIEEFAQEVLAEEEAEREEKVEAAAEEMVEEAEKEEEGPVEEAPMEEEPMEEEMAEEGSDMELERSLAGAEEEARKHEEELRVAQERASKLRDILRRREELRKEVSELMA